MKLFLESVHKSHEAAGVAIVKLADHMTDLQEVERHIKESLYEMTSTMKSTACIFAPLIAGVTIALSGSLQRYGRTGTQHIQVPAKRDPGLQIYLLRAWSFPLALDISCCNRHIPAIEHNNPCPILNSYRVGGDKSQMMYELSRALPISVIVFFCFCNSLKENIQRNI
jgi:hypothetical protein